MSAVRSGLVAEVEYVRDRVGPAWMPDAVNAARHAIAPRTVRWRAVTLNAPHASPDRGRPGRPFSDFLHLRRPPPARRTAQLPEASENASDFPEPGAIARSQSPFDVFSLIAALKMPNPFERT